MLQMQEGSIFQHSYFSLVRDSPISNRREFVLLTRPGFWVDEFVGLPSLRISSDCSEVLAQTKAVWSFVVKFLTLTEVNLISISALNSKIIEMFHSTRPVSYGNLSLMARCWILLLHKGGFHCCHLLC